MWRAGIECPKQRRLYLIHFHGFCSGDSQVREYESCLLLDANVLFTHPSFKPRWIAVKRSDQIPELSFMTLALLWFALDRFFAGICVYLNCWLMRFSKAKTFMSKNSAFFISIVHVQGSTAMLTVIACGCTAQAWWILIFYVFILFSSPLLICFFFLVA